MSRRDYKAVAFALNSTAWAVLISLRKSNYGEAEQILSHALTCIPNLPMPLQLRVVEKEVPDSDKEVKPS